MKRNYVLCIECYVQVKSKLCIVHTMLCTGEYKTIYCEEMLFFSSALTTNKLCTREYKVMFCAGNVMYCEYNAMYK